MGSVLRHHCAVRKKSCLGYCGRIHHRDQEAIAHLLTADFTALQAMP